MAYKFIIITVTLSCKEFKSSTFGFDMMINMQQTPIRYLSDSKNSRKIILLSFLQQSKELTVLAVLL